MGMFSERHIKYVNVRVSVFCSFTSCSCIQDISSRIGIYKLICTVYNSLVCVNELSLTVITYFTY